MSMLELNVYEILKAQFGEKHATTVIEYFEAKAEQKYIDKRDVFLTKQDKIDLIEKIEQSKTDLVKWMVGLFVGFFIAMVSTMFMLIKFAGLGQ